MVRHSFRSSCAIIVVGLSAALAAQAPARRTPPADLDRWVARAMQTFDVPGIALTIVKDDGVVVAKGYGVRKLGEAAQVDAKTLFGIASNTKVFTATALGMLVEEKKIEWDAPVVRYLPGFAMWDPYVTRELTVRTMGRIVEPSEFNNLVVANRGDYAVKLSDVGYAEDGAEEPRTEARLNGQPAVTLIVSKQSGQNTVAIADAVKERLREVQSTLPPGFKTTVVGDQSIFIKASINAIQTHLIEGSILAAIVVFIFLWSFRSTVIAAIGVFAGVWWLIIGTRPARATPTGATRTSPW